jgi:hypothetical protein
MSKRRVENSIPVSAGDVQEWLAAAIPDSVEEKAAVLAAAAAKALDGPALRALGESELNSVLGLKKFGPRRKLFLRIADLSAVPIADDDVEILDEAPAAAPAPAPAPAPAAGDDDEAVEDRMNAEAACVGSCRWVADRLQKILREHPGWASQALAAARTAELRTLAATAKALPRMSCVVCGTTGAGKSTLLNALLGESEVLPTNGMRACTAVLIELRYLDDAASPGDGSTYVGEAEFLTRAEWDKEEEALFEELTTQDGRAILNVSDPNAHNHGAFCKLYSVYGEAYTHESTYEIVDPTTNKKRRVAMTVPELRAKLRRHTRVTRFLGTTQKVRATHPRGFRRSLERFMDSSNLLSDGACWPIVKKVRAYGRWPVLKSGAVLVDAPGTHDSDSARGAVVKLALKEADSVWIVSNINRAVNDRSAKDLLGESFKRTLLMDGAYGRLIFVATQSDVLQRSEVVRALKLDAGASLYDCAVARNAYTRDRVKADFYAGLQDMDRAAGDAPRSAAELEAQFTMPVYCVSSVDYQKLKGVRGDDGPPQVYDAASLAATEIPALVDFVHAASLSLRARKVALQTRSLLAFAESLESVVAAKPGTGEERAERAACERAYARGVAGLPAALDAALGGFDKSVFASLEADVLPRLDAGAADAAKTCVATATTWGGSRAEGGLHWATYKATLRRGGNWRQNFNEELAEPVYRAVATHWEKAMVDKARRGLDALDGAVAKALAAAHDGLAARLGDAAAEPALAKLDAARVAAARRAHEASSSAVASSALAATKDHIQKQQKDLSREITPLVQAAMQPGYDRGFVEKGTGSHRRRCAVVESHVTKEARSMFKGAIAPVAARAARTRGSGGSRPTFASTSIRPMFGRVAVSRSARAIASGRSDARPSTTRHRAQVVAGLAKLRADVGTILKDTCARKLLDDLRLNYSVLWEPVSPEMLRVRGAMAHPLNVATCEVRSALRRLLDSQGAAPEARAGDDDDDGDIVDITSKVAAERTVEVIDVDDLDVPDAPPAPPAAASARGGVKAERA